MSKTTGTIDRARVAAALGALGLDPETVVSVAIDSGRVEAVVFDLDEHGARYLLPGNAGNYVSEGLQYAKGLTHLQIVNPPRPSYEARTVPCAACQQGGAR